MEAGGGIRIHSIGAANMIDIADIVDMITCGNYLATSFRQYRLARSVFKVSTDVELI